MYKFEFRAQDSSLHYFIHDDVFTHGFFSCSPFYFITNNIFLLFLRQKNISDSKYDCLTSCVFIEKYFYRNQGISTHLFANLYCVYVGFTDAMSTPEYTEPKQIHELSSQLREHDIIKLLLLLFLPETHGSLHF